LTSPPTAPPPAERRRPPTVAIAGILLSVALLIWVFHDVEFGKVWEHIRAARPLPFLAAVALATLTFPIRALRWQVILRDVEHRSLAFTPVWHATAIGFMANNLLPARGGELVRCFAARRLMGVRFSTALASVGVERVFDGLTVMALLALATAAPSFPAHATIGGTPVGTLAGWTAGFFAVALLGAFAVVHWPARAISALRAVTNRILPQRFGDRVVDFAAGVIGGLEVLKRPRQFALVAMWSLVHWLMAAGSFAVAYLAFDLRLPPESALLLMGLIVLGVALPAAPGFWGVFELVTRVTLEFYGLPSALAVSYAVAFHLGAFFPITILGLYSLAHAHLHLAELRSARPGDPGGGA
jgi:glycosyltransferase 2 family protein